MSTDYLPPIPSFSPISLSASPARDVIAPTPAAVESMPVAPLPPRSPPPRTRRAWTPLPVDPPADRGSNAPTAWARVGACVEPAIGLAAAATGIVALKVAPQLVAARVLPQVSAGLWAASGAAGLLGSLGEIVHRMLEGERLGTSPAIRSHAINAVATALNGLAGGLALRTPSMLRAGFESGCWGASGAGKMAHAWFDGDRPLDGRLLEGGSGALTIAAAGLGAKALEASTHEDAAGALLYSLASTATWAAADGLGGLAGVAAFREPARGQDESHGDPATLP